MKTRINLTIEESLLNQVKHYAAERKVSVSELVEQYFSQLAKPVKKSNLIDLVKSLAKTDKYDGVDLKKQYFEDNASKYGF
jgi:hypothetical protein